ncbi:MAG TPA: type ISP restriction/modification enzyme [Rhizomicrobium sp.]|jgi:hypothetical protein|nr:type ISP restriction/modification enzyme [Rhizomicrobium sp.]
MAEKHLEKAVQEFGIAARAKLSSPSISGAPEDQLRAPLEHLIRDLSEISGIPVGKVVLIGETAVAELKTRPDYAVTVWGALAGFIEIKAPGKGADPRHFSDPHDRAQWKKLQSLPNILYTDGNSFSLWQNGELTGQIVQLQGDVESSGAKLAAPHTLIALIGNFLRWTPQPPRTPKILAEVSARLCRLLREEVIEELAISNAGLTALAEDWRDLLFPEANDAQFADGYAQAVTFGLLVARARDISLKDGIDAAASELRKTSSLIGTALRLLTDDAETRKALKTSLDTLTRVLDAVDWHSLSKDKVEAWLYFYEDFLAVYDNSLRKKTGSYYTPPEVVEAMVHLVDEVLRGPLFERADGLAADDVTLADPAVGTGTFVLGVLRRIAGHVSADKGAGAVPGAIKAAASRLIGFELQFGPFAVAQLRIIAEMQDLMATAKNPLPALPELRLFITDTLGNPYVEEVKLPHIVEPIARSRRAANKVKQTERITVVIGNPPYKNQAGGRGGWIEDGSNGRPAPMDRWKPPPEWGLGAHTHHLKNLYVYFWRWATWKVFGSGFAESTGLPQPDLDGIVCFITAAGFLNGPGFQKMRDDLRRTCSNVWVIDCSPERHQPAVSSRIFQGVQHAVCIVLAARKRGKNPDEPAKVQFCALPKGDRERVKFKALAKLSLNAEDWVACSSDWRAPFLPEAQDDWAGFPFLADVFQWSSPGVKTHRTWVIAPDKESLERRWKALQNENDVENKGNLFHPDRDRSLNKIVKVDLGQHHTRALTVANDDGPVVSPCRYGFRSFDRQWIIPDHRLLSMARPELWNCHSENQVFLTAPEDVSPTAGPPITFTALIPDQHHYHGRGGRAYPLWRDAAAHEPNVRPVLLAFLAEQFGSAVTAKDMMAYIAAVMAHPAFTARFKADLIQPGLHLPLTADGALFAQACALGREVIWLHCYGERYVDPGAGRPKGAPRLPVQEAPTIPEDGAIPSNSLPDTMDYDPALRRLHIGTGYIDNVTPAMWAYEVSGVEVLKHWFSYRRRDRSRPVIGDRRLPSPLGDIQPDGWLAEYTSDLLDLLHVLGRLIGLEPAQAALLEKICAGPLYTAAELGKLWTPPTSLPEAVS